MRRAVRFTDEDLAVIESSMDRPARDVARDLGWPPQEVYGARYKVRKGWVRTDPGPWSEDELDVIKDPYLTLSQMADRLPGRTRTAVATRRHLIGVTDPTKNGVAKTSPLMPGRRTILAKTCPACGELWGAQMFSRKNTGQTESSCKPCTAKRGCSNERQLDRARAYQKAAQSISERYADHQGQEYMESDHAILRDESMTALEKAIRLRRTYRGISAAMNRNGYKQHHLPRNPERDRWVIENPNSDRIDDITAALKQEFAAAGVKFPEWDWDDDDLAANS